MKRITSASNPDYKRLLGLMQSARERRKAGLSLLDGIHLVQTYVQHVGAPEQLVVSASGAQNTEICHIINDLSGSPPLLLGDALFGALSSVATPTGIMAVVRTPRPAAMPATPGPCVMLEDVQDPGNMGSILRSAAAAGIRELYLSGGCVQCWSPRVLRAAMGAHFMLDLHEGVDLAEFARRYPGRVLTTRLGARRTIYEADLTGVVALAFGNEGAGISAALASAAGASLSIPMPGPTESLNVAAAAAVCLFERVRQSRAS